MQLRTLAYVALAVGVAVAVISSTLFLQTGDLAFLRLFLPAVLLAFGSGTALVLARVLPRGPEFAARRSVIVLGGGALIVLAGVLGFLRFRDPMLMVFAVPALAVYGVAAGVVLVRRQSQLEMASAA